MSVLPRVSGKAEEEEEAANTAPLLPNRTQNQPNLSVAPSLPPGWRHPGDLLTQIVDYRRLRAASLAGSCVSSEEKERLSELDEQLKVNSEADKREFQRFECKQVAIVRPANSDSTEKFTGEVLDISAGGVRLRTSSPLERGARVRLELRVTSEFGSKATVEFDGRVVWSRRDCTGIMFSGTPRRKKRKLRPLSRPDGVA